MQTNIALEGVAGTTVARLVWDGESPWTATQLLHAQREAEGDGAGRRSAVDEARAWLRETLAAGPRPASELRQEAAAHGIGEKALDAARKAEGVTVAKDRVPHGRWFWTLPPLPRTMAKMAPCPIPEMFAIFAKFANFNSALKYPTQIHRQEPRF